MSPIWVVLFALIAVGAIIFARRVSPEAAASGSTMNFAQTVGAGVIGLGILMLAMPWAASSTAALDFVESSDFAVLTGAAYVIGILAVLAGLALILHRETRSD